MHLDKTAEDGQQFLVKVWPRQRHKDWGPDVTAMAAAGLLTLGTALLLVTTPLHAQVGT